MSLSCPRSTRRVCRWHVLARQRHGVHALSTRLFLRQCRRRASYVRVWLVRACRRDRVHDLSQGVCETYVHAWARGLPSAVHVLVR